MVIQFFQSADIDGEKIVRLVVLFEFTIEFNMSLNVPSIYIGLVQTMESQWVYHKLGDNSNKPLSKSNRPT